MTIFNIHFPNILFISGLKLIFLTQCLFMDPDVFWFKAILLLAKCILDRCLKTSWTIHLSWITYIQVWYLYCHTCLWISIQNMLLTCNLESLYLIWCQLHCNAYLLVCMFLFFLFFFVFIHLPLHWERYSLRSLWSHKRWKKQRFWRFVLLFVVEWSPTGTSVYDCAICEDCFVCDLIGSFQISSTSCQI